MDRDEGVFIDLIVASERIAEWLDVLRSDGSLQRREQALKALALHVVKSQAYAEEARLAGVVDVLTRLFSKTGASDEPETYEAATKIIAACSGPLANSGQVREFRFARAGGPDVAVTLREGSLSDGVGVRLWVSAHELCRALGEDPEVVEGQEVLELGSGCGLCGILAAKLGARQVTLSDCDPAALQNAAANMLANDGTAITASSSAADVRDLAESYRDDSAQTAQPRHKELSGAPTPPSSIPPAHPENGNAHPAKQNGVQGAGGVSEEILESGDADLDGMWPHDEEGPRVPASTLLEPSASVWDSGNMRVRYLDWSHAPHGDEPLASHRTPFHHQRPVSVPLDHDPEDPLDTPTSDLSDLGEAPCGGRSHPLAEELKARGSESPIVAEDVDLPQDVRTHIQSTVPPALEGDEKFDVILGSDLLYESFTLPEYRAFSQDSHASMVAAAISHRMRALGCALLCLPVREKDIWDTFTSMAQLHGLEVESRTFMPAPGDEGLSNDSRGYEGGFVFAKLTKIFSNAVAPSCRHGRML